MESPPHSSEFRIDHIIIWAQNSEFRIDHIIIWAQNSEFRIEHNLYHNQIFD